MSSFENDHLVGTTNEITIHDTLNNYFKDNLIHQKEKYKKYDYKGNKYYYELKTRNNNYKTYPTTLIPYSKLMNGLEDKQIFIFSFKDGIYYIHYNKELFDTFDLMDFQRNKRVDYVDKKQLYYFIPIEHLKKI